MSAIAPPSVVESCLGGDGSDDIVGTKVVARVAIVSINGGRLHRRCTFAASEESIFAHVFVNRLNLSVFALRLARLLVHDASIVDVVVRLILALRDRGGVDGGGGAAANQVLRLVVEQELVRGARRRVVQRRRMEHRRAKGAAIIVVVVVVIDVDAAYAGRGLTARHNDLRIVVVVVVAAAAGVRLHHALIDFLHLVESGGCGGEIICCACSIAIAVL